MQAIFFFFRQLDNLSNNNSLPFHSFFLAFFSGQLDKKLDYSFIINVAVKELTVTLNVNPSNEQNVMWP
jgi:hypothetical protein